MSNQIQKLKEPEKVKKLIRAFRLVDYYLGLAKKAEKLVGEISSDMCFDDIDYAIKNS